jgi:hypothetical protein
MSTRFCAGLAFLLCSLASLSSQAQTAGPPWPAEVAAPSTHRLKFDSAVNGESYTLFIRTPLTPPPAQGYPVSCSTAILVRAASDIALSIP